jgi:phage RecT family recombinase
MIMSNQLMTIEESVYSVSEIAKGYASKHDWMDLSAEQNYAVQHLYKNSMAADTARANPVSVQNAITNLSSIGISLNPALRHAYLVPRDKAICLDISYMGLMHLAQEIGSILWGQAKIVYEKDEYVSMGLDKEPSHKYKAFGDRGDKVGCYCTVKLPNGDFLTEEMDSEQVLAVRDKSKSKSSDYSPWNTFEAEMWRKTVVKRASKYWPKSSGRLDTAIHVINEHEGLENNDEENVTLVKKLQMYGSDEFTPIELFGFTESVRAKSDKQHQWLCSQFEKGKKSAGSKKIGDGRRMFFEYIEIFKAGDETQILECKEELSELELTMLQKHLGEKYEYTSKP